MFSGFSFGCLLGRLFSLHHSHRLNSCDLSRILEVKSFLKMGQTGLFLFIDVLFGRTNTINDTSVDGVLGT